MTAYMGVSDKGETFYYAESPDGKEGIMVVLDPQTGDYASFVGPVSNPSDTQVTIEDETTGMTLTFEVTAAENGAIAIDLGDEGKAVLAECSFNEVLEAFATIGKYGNDVTVNPPTSQSAASESSASSTTSSGGSGVTSNVTAEQEASIANMSAYMGVSDKEETFYYAESPDGKEGVMVVLNPKTGEYASFVGAVSNPSDTQVTIADESTGNTLTFEVTAAENGAVAIDLGEQGKAVLVECTPKEVIDALATINEYGKPVA